MDNLRKRFNTKGRIKAAAVVQNQDTQSVVVDMADKEKYDASNPLVIVSKKKSHKPVEKQNTQTSKKPLSKKQKKKLEKILEAKKKKQNRAELLKKLSEVQASTNILNHLTSTADMQTFGIKRLANESLRVRKRRKISNIKGLKSNRESDESQVDSSESSSDDQVDVITTETTKEKSPAKRQKRQKISNIKGLKSNRESDESHVDSSDSSNDDQVDVITTETTKEKSPAKEVRKENETNISGENVISDKPTCTPTIFVPVYRKPEIQAVRESLPIYSEEQPLIEAIKENSVIIVHGETGSGKTTQVPQFLYEAGFTQNNMLIGITEPRRIAAMSMASRVGEEMNMPNAVSYHIRYEKTVNPETQIKFMTDGVLLKELKQDFWLSKYSVIIIDEAHERSVYSDVLIGLLSRIIHRHEKERKGKKYPPLKLIIMSATLCVEEFMENPRLFKTKPFLIKVSSRQYTVQAHFNKHTPHDYVEAAYNKVCKIHRQLPPGAILVFMTGEKEINKLCQILRDTFPVKEFDANKEDEKSSPDIFKKRKKGKFKKSQNDMSSVPDINLDDFTIEPLDTEDLQHQLSEDEDSPNINFVIQKLETSSHPLYVLPLYSALPLEEQEKVFKPPPLGSRLCVVSTNIAETSVTIPGLKYVVDSGKVKTKVYNSNSGGVSQFVVTWCSKASANQRTGRAGRTEGGHCYRLYSSSVFENEFPDFSTPEILRTPSDDVLLQMKALGIPKVVHFPFPTPPDIEALKAAEKRLILLDALEDIQNKEGRYKESKEREFSAPVTRFGMHMARFPLSPRYSAMLLLSKKHDCIPYIVAITCAMTVPEVFLSSTVHSSEDGENNENIKVVWEGIKKIGVGDGKFLRLGDAMVLLRAVALYEESKKKVKFCIKNKIRHRAMVEIHQMGLQLLKEMNQAYTLDMPLTLQMDYPSAEVIEKLRKILSAGFVDHIARKIPVEESKKDKNLKNAYQCMELEDAVFIHPSSILFTELPEYVVYQEINHTSKYYMKGVVEIESHWIPGIAESLCSFSEPKENPPPQYNASNDRIYVTMDIRVGRWSWEISNANIEMPKGLAKYQWFAFFLLDGQVCSFFKNYRRILGPSFVFKKWARTYKPGYCHFVSALVSLGVDSRQTLQDMWRKDSKYLLQEYLALVPKNKHLEVKVKWPPFAVFPRS